ncbi:MAG: FadR family transcriptional regulator [Acetobacteraceae bacterium]|nr:FadR family transcriptional regulator [Acetobacteraceae bacterium]
MAGLRQSQTTRSADLASRLRAQILGGGLGPGTRLPTEQELAREAGVSRTVVREAVAAVRAEGLIVTRQGSGAYVAERTEQIAFRLPEGAIDSLQRVIGVMELRIGVETEAASLAAARRNADDVKRIVMALRAMEDAAKRGERSIVIDFDFHLAIADATRNDNFREFLDYLSRFFIPRNSVRQATTSLEAQTANAMLVAVEHRAILDAIRGRDTEAARAAMRAHLVNSRERTRALRERLRAHGA